LLVFDIINRDFIVIKNIHCNRKMTCLKFCFGWLIIVVTKFVNIITLIKKTVREIDYPKWLSTYSSKKPRFSSRNTGLNYSEVMWIKL